ncbi:MAG: hypothetical protein HFJ53_00470 [Clostridia bacterium]|nr:hypothetical protein [Clostridia bacterium]
MDKVEIEVENEVLKVDKEESNKKEETKKQNNNKNSSKKKNSTNKKNSTKKENKKEITQEKIKEENEKITENKQEESIEKENELNCIKEKELEKENEEIIKEEPKEEVINEILDNDTTKEEQTKIEKQSDLEPGEEPKVKNNINKVILILSIILLIILLSFSTIFALINKNTNKIIKGVSIKGIDISELSLEEAKQKVNENYIDKLKQNIILKQDEYETSLTPEQIEANFKIDETIEEAYNVGRSGKILKDNYKIISVNINKIDITPQLKYNNEALDNFITNISENLPNSVKTPTYEIDGNKLIVTKGKQGVKVKQEQLKKMILESMEKLDKETITIEIPVEIEEPEAVDLKKIRDEIYKEPKDAYYTKEPFTVYPHVNGIDFKISMEEANKLIETQEEQIIIPLKITYPKVTTNQIGTEAFPNLLASYSTTFSTKNVNRTTNIKLSTNKINGVVLLPRRNFFIQ